MIPKPATWKDARVGGYVLDANDKIWKIGALNETHAGLTDRDGVEKIIPRPPLDRPVRVFFLSQEEMEAQIRDLLGGTLEAVKGPGDSIFICREFATMRTNEKISHIKLMHRVWAGDKANSTPKQLTECHDELHRTPSDKWVPHLHADTVNRPSPFDTQEV